MEIAEQTVSPASGETVSPASGETVSPASGETVSPASVETIPPASGNTTLPPGVYPSEEIRLISYHKSLSSGASIGPAENQQIAGTLGPFLRIVTDGTPQFFALACSHVLSSLSFLSQIIVYLLIL
jgi:hypothetical protein